MCKHQLPDWADGNESGLAEFNGALLSYTASPVDPREVFREDARLDCPMLVVTEGNIPEVRSDTLPLMAGPESLYAGMDVWIVGYVVPADAQEPLGSDRLRAVPKSAVRARVKQLKANHGNAIAIAKGVPSTQKLRGASGGAVVVRRDDAWVVVGICMGVMHTHEPLFGLKLSSDYIAFCAREAWWSDVMMTATYP